jgi:hypothetical protein
MNPPGLILTTMSLLSLHNDILLEIIKHLAASTRRAAIDTRSIIMLSSLCWRLRDLYITYYTDITAMFTRVKTINEETQYYLCGKLHREGDLPAIVSNDSFDRIWYHHGRRARSSDLPAYYDGYLWEWNMGGDLHRDDRPAAVTMICEGDMTLVLRLWDGHTDVSIDSFDWRQIISIDPENVSLIIIVYTWYHHGDITRCEHRRLMCHEDGRYLVRLC